MIKIDFSNYFYLLALNLVLFILCLINIVILNYNIFNNKILFILK